MSATTETASTQPPDTDIAYRLIDVVFTSELRAKTYRYWAKASYGLKRGDYAIVSVSGTHKRVRVTWTSTKAYGTSSGRACKSIVAPCEPPAISSGITGGRVTSIVFDDPLVDFKTSTLRYDDIADAYARSVQTKPIHESDGGAKVTDDTFGSAVRYKPQWGANLFEDFARRHFNIPKAKEPTVLFKIETITFVNGKEANKLDANELYDMIVAAEAEINKLEGLKNKPNKVAARIAELNDGIRQLIEVLDGAKKDIPNVVVENNVDPADPA